MEVHWGMSVKAVAGEDGDLVLDPELGASGGMWSKPLRSLTRMLAALFWMR